MYNGSNDFDMAATFWATASDDLTFSATFLYYPFEEGDHVLFKYNGAHCQGSVVEQVFDGTDVNNNYTYRVRVNYCTNWDAVGDSSEVIVHASDLTLVLPPSW